MKLKDLIAQLSQYPEDTDVAIFDQKRSLLEADGDPNGAGVYTEFEFSYHPTQEIEGEVLPEILLLSFENAFIDDEIADTIPYSNLSKDEARDLVAKNHGFSTLVDTGGWTRWQRMIDGHTPHTINVLIDEAMELYAQSKLQQYVIIAGSQVMVPEDTLSVLDALSFLEENNYFGPDTPDLCFSLLDGRKLSLKHLLTNYMRGCDRLADLTELQFDYGYKMGTLSPVALLGLFGEAGEVLNEAVFTRDLVDVVYLKEQRIAIDVAELIDSIKKKIRKKPFSEAPQVLITAEDEGLKFDLELADVLYYLNLCAVGRRRNLHYYAQLSIDKVKAKALKATAEKCPNCDEDLDDLPCCCK